MFCFNEFAFTIEVKQKINSTQIPGFILICLYFTTGHFHTRVLCKEWACFLYNSWLSFQRLCCNFWGFSYGATLFVQQVVRHIHDESKWWSSGLLWLAGFVYDWTRNYDHSFMVSGVMFVAGGAVCCLLHLPRFQRQKFSAQQQQPQPESTDIKL